MFYREAKQYKTDYASDMAVFPLKEDRLFIAAAIIFAFAMPFFASKFILGSVMIPFLVFVIAAIGLNILTGYTGLVSLGTAAFMGVGAYACYKLTTIFPHVNVIIWILVSGFFAAAVGVLFGIPSLRIKGFYLAVATLAAQFFLQWSFVRIPWLYNYNASGAIEVPQRKMFDIVITGANASINTRYFILLVLVIFLTWLASNLLHGRLGRAFMAVRDMDIAAELMGINLLKTKLLAFGVSSYFAGVSGACMVFLWYGQGEANDLFNINQSFLLLFMVIIGGLGSLIGSYMGAFFIVTLPTILKFGPPLIGINIQGDTIEHFTTMIIGALIIFFLRVEPHGLARLWQIAKQKLRVWPFPY